MIVTFLLVVAIAAALLGASWWVPIGLVYAVLVYGMVLAALNGLLALHAAPLPRRVMSAQRVRSWRRWSLVAGGAVAVQVAFAFSAGWDMLSVALVSVNALAFVLVFSERWWYQWT